MLYYPCGCLGVHIKFACNYWIKITVSFTQIQSKCSFILIVFHSSFWKNKLIKKILSVKTRFLLVTIMNLNIIPFIDVCCLKYFLRCYIFIKFTIVLEWNLNTNFPDSPFLRINWLCYSFSLHSQALNFFKNGQLKAKLKKCLITCGGFGWNYLNLAV